MRKQIVAGLGAAAIVVASSSLLASIGTSNNVGQFEAACNAITGAAFTPSGQPAGKQSTCVSQSTQNQTITNNVSSSDQGNSIWTIEQTRTVTTTYTFDIPSPGGGPVVTQNSVDGGWVTTSCTNPGGQPFDLSHQHCNP